MGDEECTLAAEPQKRGKKGENRNPTTVNRFGNNVNTTGRGGDWSAKDWEALLSLKYKNQKSTYPSANLIVIRYANRKYFDRSLNFTVEELYLRRWVRGQFTKPVPPAKDLDLSGQTGILVGGTDGIGLACGHELLKRKLSTLVLGARNMEKGKAVANKLKEQYPSADIKVWDLEMLSYDSVQEFAKRCATLERIDFAIIGAGALPSEFRLNPSTGHEVTMQVHYWSTALLSLLLLPLLKEKHARGKPAHLTIISSDLAHIAEFKEKSSNPLLAAFDKHVSWSTNMATERYNCCKMLLMMFVLKLKDAVDPSDVVVNTVCPGMSKPTLNERDQPWIFRTMIRFARHVLGRPLDACAWIYLNAAVEQGRESHGSFLASWQIAPFPKLMYTEEGRKITDRAWTETLDALEFASVKELLNSMSTERQL